MRGLLFKVVATFLLAIGASAQSKQKIVNRIARYNHVKKNEVELIEVVALKEKRPRANAVRRINSEIGMPAGFGRGPLQISSEFWTVYYVSYQVPRGRFVAKMDRYYRNVWFEHKRL